MFEKRRKPLIGFVASVISERISRVSWLWSPDKKILFRNLLHVKHCQIEICPVSDKKSKKQT